MPKPNKGGWRTWGAIPATLVVLVACSSKEEAAQHKDESGGAVASPSRADRFPRVGVAVRDTAGRWCAEFMNDSAAAAIKSGDQVAIVFPGGTTIASLSARVAGPQTEQCHAEFAQPRWIDYSAFRLDLMGTQPAAGTQMPDVALAVTGDAKWIRDADGIVRADLDGDGTREEAIRCTANEGEHLTIWSPIPTAARTRRWHEYYDWGAFTKPTCKPGEGG